MRTNWCVYPGYSEALQQEDPAHSSQVTAVFAGLFFSDTSQFNVSPAPLNPDKIYCQFSLNRFTSQFYLFCVRFLLEQYGAHVLGILFTPDTGDI